MYNRIILVGNLTFDPELRYGTSGTAICNLKLAVNEKVKKGDSWEDEVLFMKVVVFGKQAENCDKYLEKGRGVLVEGRLKLSKWVGKDGSDKETPEVIAQTVKFLPSRDKPAAGTVQATPEVIPENTTELEPF